MAAGLGFFVFLLYLGTLAPTVLYYSPEFFDALRFQVRVPGLGIPNPTGYPTYMLLGKLFTYLPVGDIAYRINLSSAVYGTLAVAAVYAVGRRLTGRPAPAAAGALAFGVGQTYWSQAVIPEVYTLNALLISLPILALLVWREKRKNGYLLAAAFLSGFALTNHMTSGVLIPGALAFVLLVDGRKFLSLRLVLGAAGLFALGLVPYAYLPIRAATDPLLGDDVPGFLLFILTGGEHKDLMFAFGPAELPGRLLMYFRNLLENFNPLLLAAGVLGIAGLFRRDKAALVLLGIPLLASLAYILEYDIYDYQLYFIPPHLFLSVFVSVGLWRIMDWLERVPGSRSRWAVRLVPALAVGVTLLAVPGTFNKVDMSDDYRGRRIIEAVARDTEPDATILQHASPLGYMTNIEGRRRDLNIVNPQRSGRWVEEAEAGLKTGAVYVVSPTPDVSRFFREAGYRLEPVEKKVLYEVESGPRKAYSRRADAASGQ